MDHLGDIDPPVEGWWSVQECSHNVNIYELLSLLISFRTIFWKQTLCLQGFFFFFFSFHPIKVQSEQVLPARSPVCSWHCWHPAALLQNKGSQLGQEQETDPVYTTAGLQQKQSREYFIVQSSHLHAFLDSCIQNYLVGTSLCQKSGQQRPSPVCRAFGCTVSPPGSAHSRRLCSGTDVWWRCPPGLPGPECLSPRGPKVFWWCGAGGQTLWARREGNGHSAWYLNCRGRRGPGAAAPVRSCIHLGESPVCSASAFLRSRNWPSSGWTLWR